MAEVEVVPPDRPIAGLVSHCGTSLMGRQNLLGLPTPEPTDTHKPIAHIHLVESILESLAFRHINVVKEEFAVSQDGMKLFGCLDLETMGAMIVNGIGPIRPISQTFQRSTVTRN